MECKKCRKECLENELKNGVCNDCTTKSKNNMVTTILVSVIISVILSLIIIGWANSEVSISDFKIESFDMETEKTTYTYSDNYWTYNGKGRISCNNKNESYIVLLEKINKTKNETDYISVVIHNGEGEFSTYDSNYDGTTEKPKYEFNIIGYRSFKN